MNFGVFLLAFPSHQFGLCHQQNRLPGFSYVSEAIQQPLKLLSTGSLVLYHVSFQMEI